MRVRLKNKRSAKRRCTGKGEAIAYYLQYKKAPPLALSSLVEYHPSEVVAPKNAHLDLLPPIWQSHFTGINSGNFSKIDTREVTVLCDVYFNVLMKIIEEITIQINFFTFIFLGKDVVIKGEVQS